MKQPEIGKQVASLRLQRGITQEKLAELCEVSTRTIQRIESGEVDPRAFTVNNLSNILDYDFNDDNKSNEIFWLTALHLSSIFCIVFIPLLIWSLRKKYSLKINEHGKAVLNFQITFTILLLSVTALYIMLLPTFIILMEKYNMGNVELFGILSIAGLLPLIALGLICFFQGLFNAAKVLNDKPYKYILSIPFLK